MIFLCSIILHTLSESNLLQRNAKHVWNGNTIPEKISTSHHCDCQTWLGSVQKRISLSVPHDLAKTAHSVPGHKKSNTYIWIKWRALFFHCSFLSPLWLKWNKSGWNASTVWLSWQRCVSHTLILNSSVIIFWWFATYHLGNKFNQRSRWHSPCTH